MLKNYLTIAWRNLWKHRGFSLWNIVGLALGIAGACMVFLLVQFELSFDGHHPESDNIFRIVMEDNAHGNRRFTQAMPYPLPETVRADFNQIEALTIVDANVQSPIVNIVRNKQVNRYKEERGIAYVDPDYFQIFPYQWVLGSPQSALSEQKTVVLSESLATKYFGDENPLDQIININNNLDLRVTGVVKDAPQNTDLPFNMLISINLGEEDKRGWEGWDASSGRVHCYLKLKNQDDLAYMNKQLEPYFGNHWHEDYAKQVRLFLQPLGDVHYDIRFSTFGGRVVSKKSLWAMGFIGLVLLITSCINFINLNTVLAAQRSKEIGVRKVLGGQRAQLIWQFLGETFLVTTLAVLGAVIMMRLGFVLVEDLVGYGLDFDLVRVISLALFLIAVLILVCILAGLYPAFLVSSFKPIEAIKNSINVSSKSGFSLRTTLVTAQLVISQALIICTLVVTNQLDYFQKSSMGFNKEAIIEFPLPVQNASKAALIAQSLNGQTGINAYSLSNTGAASDDSWAGDFTFDNGKDLLTAYTQVKFIDEHFLTTYEIPLSAGDNLPPSDSANMFLVNESFVTSMGLTSSEQAIGKYITFWGVEAPIQGVVQDFNASSLHHAIQPCIFLVGANRYMMGGVKVAGPDISKTIANIDEAWTKIYPDYIFEYQFLDETITEFYNAEQKLSSLFKVFTTLAIIIGCIGLLGLITFVTAGKFKEIGVRKVLGATTSNVVLLLSRHFILVTCFALLVSIPISYYIMKNWLENFTYRVNLEVEVFLTAAIVSLLLVGLTVGYKTFQAAIANPADALKTQ